RSGRSPSLRLRVQFHAQLPGGAQRSQQHVLTHGSEPNMGSTVAAPSAGNGQEDFRRLGHKHRLLLGSEHQVAVAVLFRGKGGEDASPDAKVGGAEVGTFFGSFKRKRETAKIVGLHLQWLSV